MKWLDPWTHLSNIGQGIDPPAPSLPSSSRVNRLFFDHRIGVLQHYQSLVIQPQSIPRNNISPVVKEVYAALTTTQTGSKPSPDSEETFWLGVVEPENTFLPLFDNYPLLPKTRNIVKEESYAPGSAFAHSIAGLVCMNVLIAPLSLIKKRSLSSAN